MPFFKIFFCVPVFDGARLPFWTLNYLQVFSVPSTGRAREDPTLAMQLLQVWSRETNQNAEDRFLPLLLLVKAVRLRRVLPSVKAVLLPFPTTASLFSVRGLHTVFFSLSSGGH